MTSVVYGGKTYPSIAALARAIRQKNRRQGKSYGVLVRAIRDGEIGKRVPTAKLTPSLIKRRPAKKPVTK